MDDDDDDLTVSTIVRPSGLSGFCIDFKRDQQL